MTTTKDAPPCEHLGNERSEAMRSQQADLSSLNKEWDMCVKKGTLTVGAGMAAGMFLGTLMGMGVPLAWGTGAGILWSVKRCRALMRDGILTPEQVRQKKEKKAKDRLEKKRELEEKRKKTLSSPGLKPKGGRGLDIAKDDHECCKKLKELLEQQKQKECELLKKMEKELEKCGTVDKSITDQLGECTRDDKKENTETPWDGSAVGNSKLNFKSTTTVKLFVPQTQAFRTRILADGTDMCMCMVGKDGKMETCSGCATLLSSRKELDEPTQLTLLDENIKKDIENDYKVSFSEPQEAADEDQNDDSVESHTEIQPEDGNNRKNPSDLLVLQEVNSMTEGRNVEEDVDYEDEQNSALFLNEQPSPLDEDMEEEVIEINGDHIEVIIQEVDDDTGDDDEEDDDFSAEPEVTFPEVVGDFAQKLSNHDEASIAEEFAKEEVIFVETYKSESWPFSFSLPSLDKFHKKSTDSTFKWPPLPSSIIVKPRKEPTCTCAGGNTKGEQYKDGDGNLQPEPLNNVQACSCGQPEDKCNCKVQGHT